MCWYWHGAKWSIGWSWCGMLTGMLWNGVEHSNYGVELDWRSGWGI